MAERAYHSLLAGQTRFHFWRLTDGEENVLRRNSVPIRVDSSILWNLRWQEHWDSNHFTLAKALLILERLFGQSSQWIDDWKGTFGFPLLLKIEKPDSSYFYLLNIYDIRGSIDFSLYRIIVAGLLDRSTYTYQNPVETEFSAQEIKEFLILLYSYFKDASYFLAKHHTQPFLRHVDSEHLIYGYWDGQFFEQEFESEAEFKAAIADVAERYGSQIQQPLADDVQAMIQQIVRITSRLPDGSEDQQSSSPSS